MYTNYKDRLKYNFKVKLVFNIETSCCLYIIIKYYCFELLKIV